jgi:2-oxo-4-hydroxy-4-carboxy-5-ureidoimidazoline decarboxylase
LIYSLLSTSQQHFVDICFESKIGDAKTLKEKFSKVAASGPSWESNEQSGTNTASEETLQALAILNTEYELKHGFIFLICATGKSADEMLRALRIRLDYDTATEIQHAASEQQLITVLRLNKLLQSLQAQTAPSISTISKL